MRCNSDNYNFSNLLPLVSRQRRPYHLRVSTKYLARKSLLEYHLSKQSSKLVCLWRVASHTLKTLQNTLLNDHAFRRCSINRRLWGLVIKNSLNYRTHITGKSFKFFHTFFSAYGQKGLLMAIGLPYCAALFCQLLFYSSNNVSPFRLFYSF